MRHHEYDAGECGEMLRAWSEKMTPVEFEYRAIVRRRESERDPLSHVAWFTIGLALYVVVIWLVATGLVR